MTRLIVLAALVALLVPVAAGAASFNALVTWGAVTGADSYVVEKKTGDAAFVQVATPTAATFADTGLALGTAYCYRVAAKNSVGQSAFSAEACGTTGNLPAVPGGIQVIFTYVP